MSIGVLGGIDRSSGKGSACSRCCHTTGHTNRGRDEHGHDKVVCGFFFKIICAVCIALEFLTTIRLPTGTVCRISTENVRPCTFLPSVLVREDRKKQ